MLSSWDCCTYSSINKPVKNNTTLLLLSTSNRPVQLQATTVNVGKSLAKHIVSNVDLMSYIDYSENTVQDVYTTVDDIKTIVSQLNNSAAGHDELSPSIMKQLCNTYCIPLSYIINFSIIQETMLYDYHDN